MSFDETGLRFLEVETDWQRDAAHRLRYQVYVLERGFEDPAERTDGRERDDFDDVSWHFLCLTNDGAPVGTVRLIHDPTRRYPMETACEIEEPLASCFRPHLGEVSRLAVSKEFRRRADDTIYGVEGQGDAPGPELVSDRRGLPVLFLGLLRAAYQKSVREGLTHVYAAMERQLHVLLRRFCIRFEPLGPEVSYHGPRRPYVLHLAEFERDCVTRRPDVYEFFRRGMPAELTAGRLLARILEECSLLDIVPRPVKRALAG